MLIKDKKGRYLIVQGTLLLENLNLVNVYQDLFLLLSALPGRYVIAGDFNCTLHPGIDRSVGTDQSHSNSRMTLQSFIKDFRLLDIFRELHQQTKVYSCYSATFQTYSRIDYFLISSELLSKIQV